MSDAHQNYTQMIALNLKPSEKIAKPELYPIRFKVGGGFSLILLNLCLGSSVRRIWDTNLKFIAFDIPKLMINQNFNFLLLTKRMLI